MTARPAVGGLGVPNEKQRGPVRPVTPGAALRFGLSSRRGRRRGNELHARVDNRAPSVLDAFFHVLEDPTCGARELSNGWRQFGLGALGGRRARARCRRAARRTAHLGAQRGESVGIVSER